MSQSAVVPEQVCLQQPFELSETVLSCCLFAPYRSQFKSNLYFIHT